MAKKSNYDYENEVIEEDLDFTGVDIKINPDYYIHFAIVKAQNALINENVEAGFLQYRLIVEHVEILCKAAKKWPEEYEKLLEDFKKTKEFTEEKNHLVRNVLLANKKLELLASEIFQSKFTSAGLKLS